MPLLGIGAVDLIAFLVALAAVLAVGALWVLFQPLSSLMRAVPLVGGQIADAINSGLKLAMQGVILAYSAISHSVAHFLWTYGVGIWHVVYNITQGITQALGLANQAVSAAGSVAAQLPVDISGAISSANSYADGVLSTAEQDAANLFNEVNARASALYNDALIQAENFDATLQQAVTGQIAAAVNALDGEITAVDQRASALYNDALVQAEGFTATLENTLDTRIANVEDVLNGEISNIIGQVDALSGDIAGLATVATVAGLLTQVATISTEIDTCLEPLCDTVTPNAGKLGELGSLLSGIDGIVDAALLTGLLTAAVADPKAAATAVVSTGGWLSTLGVDAANAFGLAV